MRINVQKFQKKVIHYFVADLDSLQVTRLFGLNDNWVNRYFVRPENVSLSSVKLNSLYWKKLKLM